MSSSALIAPAAKEEVATLFVGFELSKSTWLVGLYAPELGKSISRHKVDGGDADAALELIATASRRLGRMGKPVRVVSIYEAGFDGFWLHRRLTTAGIESRVIDAASIPVDRRSRRAKTDRLDLELLLRMLLALERGETRICRVVQVPSPAEEDAKRQHRERAVLVAERTAHSNRITGILMALGIRDVNPHRRDFVERLDDLMTATGEPVPPHTKRALAREHERLGLVERQIKEIERAQATEMKTATKEQGDRKEARGGGAAVCSAAQAAALVRLRGIGQVSAVPLCREVFYRQFNNRRELAGYFGLTPSPYNSGSTRIDQGISKAGNPHARSLAIEVAWLWVRHQPNSALTNWFLQRVGDAKGRIRRIAIVALARKLMVALWRYLTTGLIPEGAVMSPA
ncbi:MAG: IS110 family transposase [Acetobacteraceae bacterium]|nr:IS110 family transposase [Acetobacteraceae bacterium]